MKYANRDIEASVFYHLMTNKGIARKVFDSLTADDFANDDLRTAFEKIEQAYSAGTQITVDQRCVDWLAAHSTDASMSLMTSASNAISAIQLQSLRRKMDRACRHTRSVIDDPTVSIEDLVSASEHYRAEVTAKCVLSQDTSGAAAAKSYVQAKAQAANGNVQRIETGIYLIDERLRIMPENLVVLSARPGMGKTSTAITWSANQISHGLAVPGFFSLEMSLSEITTRVVSSMSGIPHESLLRNEMTDHDMRKEVEALDRLTASGAQFHSPERKMSMADIGGMAEQWVKKHGVNILYIDQLSTIKHRNQRASLREQFSESSDACKELAKRLSVPVVMIAQQRRTEDGAKPRPPQLGQIKETSYIEEVADVVLMPWRPEDEDVMAMQYAGKQVDTTGKCFMYCRKYRNGRKFSVVLEWDGQTMTMGRARV